MYVQQGPARPAPTAHLLPPPVVLAINMLQRYREQDVFVRLHLHPPRVREHMVARAQVAPHLRLPVCHVPLEPLGRDPARLFERDDADVLAEDGLLAVLADLDSMRPRLKEERQTRPGEQEDAPVAVGAVLLEQVQVVQLAEPLVDAAADAAEGDDVDTGRVLVAHVLDGLAEVGRVLGRVVDDLGGRRLRGVEVADGGVEGIEVSDDDLEVRLGFGGQRSAVLLSTCLDGARYAGRTSSLV